MAQSLEVEGSNYTSQLTVSVTPRSDLNGKTIMCLYDNFPINKTIWVSTINITGILLLYVYIYCICIYIYIYIYI